MQPPCLHCQTKLITQIINLLGNICLFVHPNMVCNTKFAMNLKIITIITIITIMHIFEIIEISMKITWLHCFSVLNPQFQKISSIKWTMSLFRTNVFLAMQPFEDNLDMKKRKQIQSQAKIWVQGILHTCPLQHSLEHQAWFRQLDARLTYQIAWPGKDRSPRQEPETGKICPFKIRKWFK